ncbi:copper resistance protein CopB [Xanthomonas oryzae pv. oryzicola]|nr:copper resistance protein CopB [Xanthomonas oryzae pv. oryzicola]UBB93686.1 copper resistance protein B [Xanthomonas oryzae pv. oryzicola]ULX25125.1 copper resistance protein B [Xanthomonas oryzae pv. oryzicola]UNW43183.1 copper resistance protein B [Xanthomonas oryzae pv. oryzicola]WGY41648.1 copper resistance protein B [Xanthomonas oryzae pv. oryzicola]
MRSRRFGDSAQRAAMDDAPARDRRLVAGVRLWF